MNSEFSRMLLVDFAFSENAKFWGKTVYNTTGDILKDQFSPIINVAKGVKNVVSAPFNGKAKQAVKQTTSAFKDGAKKAVTVVKNSPAVLVDDVKSAVKAVGNEAKEVVKHPITYGGQKAVNINESIERKANDNRDENGNHRPLDYDKLVGGAKRFVDKAAGRDTRSVGKKLVDKVTTSAKDGSAKDFVSAFKNGKNAFDKSRERGHGVSEALSSAFKAGSHSNEISSKLGEKVGNFVKDFKDSNTGKAVTETVGKAAEAVKGKGADQIFASAAKLFTK